jgi:multidrug resistance efflux pump
MKGKMYSIDDISDSREMLEARTPRFMSVFIFSLFFMLIVGFVWMWFGEIDESVKVTGIVRPLVPVSTVRNIAGGRVKTVAYKDESTVKKGDILYIIDSKPVESEIGNTGTRLNRARLKSKNLLSFERCLQQRRNMFPESNAEYYNKYLVYEYELEKLNLAYIKAKSAYDIQNGLPGSIPEIELEQLASETRLAEINMNKYKSENIVSLKSEIEATDNEILRLTDELGKLEENLAFCTVRSPIAGKVQSLYSFNQGDYLPPDTEIVRIIPENDSFLKVDLIIPNKDIGRINPGEKIQYSFLSLPKSEYGFLYGNVTKIPPDTAQGENSKTLVYLAEGSLRDTEMVDAHNNKTQVRIGMACEARIILRKKRIFISLLENLNFL